MSDLSSKAIVEENSCCESESDSERREKINKYKNKKRKKELEMRNQQQQIQQQQSTDDDETESQQLNFEDPQINSSTPISSPMSIYNQDKMRRRLQFHFMNPIEKWQAKRR